MGETPRISCIICTVNRADSIGRAIASVLANDETDIELIVVDQSADDATRDACAPFRSDARFRYTHTDKAGLSRAYNIGIANARAGIIAFTDDDCVAHDDWAGSVLRVFAENPDVDMIYGRTLLPVEHEQGDEIIPALDFPEPRRIDRSTGIKIIGMGANFAIRQRLIQRVGLFDEALGGGGPLRSSQDYDFQYRVYLANAVVRLSPEVNVDHYGARRRGDQWRKTQEAYGIGDGAFYWKHVRCHDFTALRLTVQLLARLLVREMLNPLRRKPSRWTYARSFLVGMKKSMRFRVDVPDRLYVLDERGSR